MLTCAFKLGELNLFLSQNALIQVTLVHTTSATVMFHSHLVLQIINVVTNFVSIRSVPSVAF